MRLPSASGTVSPGRLAAGRAGVGAPGPSELVGQQSGQLDLAVHGGGQAGPTVHGGAPVHGDHGRPVAPQAQAALQDLLLTTQLQEGRREGAASASSALTRPLYPPRQPSTLGWGRHPTWAGPGAQSSARSASQGHSPEKLPGRRFLCCPERAAGRGLLHLQLLCIPPWWGCKLQGRVVALS